MCPEEFSRLWKFFSNFITVPLTPTDNGVRKSLLYTQCKQRMSFSAHSETFSRCFVTILQRFIARCTAKFLRSRHSSWVSSKPFPVKNCFCFSFAFFRWQFTFPAFQMETEKEKLSEVPSWFLLIHVFISTPNPTAWQQQMFNNKSGNRGIFFSLRDE